jgi:hypothetical protein
MLRTRYKRTFELIDLVEDRCDPNAYFREFETRVVTEENLQRAWAARECEFKKLSREAWNRLKGDAKPHLLKNATNPRAWSQLINTLNEARGYIYLRSKGCPEPEFIPRAKQGGIETPDLKGTRGDQIAILCEVKTINISDDEVTARSDIRSRSTEAELPPPFFIKLGKTLEKAFSQLTCYAPNEVAERVVLIIPNFDDFLGEYKSAYYAQIDEFLGRTEKRNCSVAVFNSRTAFHAEIEMLNAEVVNE